MFGFPHRTLWAGKILLVEPGERPASAKFLWALIATFSLISSTNAGTVVVTNTNDSLAGSLRQAIQDAVGGDTITFNIPTSDPGYNSANATWTITLSSGQLIISKGLTVTGAEKRIVVRRSTAQGTPLEGIFKITSGLVLLDNLNITAGFANSLAATDGGGIANAGTLTVRGCAIYSNSTAGNGGGIYNTGKLTVLNCTIANNTAGGGGGISNQGDLTVLSTTISTNYGTGRALYTSGVARIGNSVLASASSGEACVEGTVTSQGYNFISYLDNSTGFGGSGSHDQFGTRAAPADPKLGPLQDNGGPTQTMLPLPGSPLIDQGNSSGITTDQRGFRRPLENPTIANAGDASDIGAVETDVVQSGPNFVVTTTDEHSDGFCGQGDCSLWDAANASNNSTTNNNVISFRPGLSGAITTKLQSVGIILARPVTITGPGAELLTLTSLGAGRVFWNQAAGVTISGFNIANCFFNGDGGAVFNQDALTIQDCSFFGNVATGVGGAIYNNPSASITLRRCSFLNNQVTRYYGGAIQNSGNLAATNCTFSGNSAGDFAGAISTAGTSFILLNCTVSNNSARNASGGLDWNSLSGPAHLGNTIVAGNSAPISPDLDGTFTSDGNNFIGKSDGSNGFVNGVKSDQVGAVAAPKNPKLALPAHNGGPTDTMALLPGSTAIDAGNDTLAPPEDQRGHARVGVSDIGAFEFVPAATPTPSPSASPTSSPGSHSLSNISTRGVVGNGDNVLIGGLVIAGPGPKKVLVRALGPTLTQLGVSSAIDNPQLELFQGQTLLATNDDWISASNAAEITASTFAPPNPIEAAILISLDPGNYTAIVRGANGGTGVSIVECYDLESSQPSRFQNISTRGFVQTGDNVMIAGVVVNGPDNQTVLIRGLGPTLTQFGVPDVLADPLLDLRDMNGNVVTSNNNWMSSQQAEIQATPYPPSNDREAAILITLTPGNYTAILSGVGNTTGNALVEIYALN